MKIQSHVLAGGMLALSLILQASFNTAAAQDRAATSSGAVSQGSSDRGLASNSASGGGWARDIISAPAVSSYTSNYDLLDLKASQQGEERRRPRGVNSRYASNGYYGSEHADLLDLQIAPQHEERRRRRNRDIRTSGGYGGGYY